MPRAAPIQTSFNAGELSYSVEGRPDIAKYANGCKTLENYLPTIQGPAKRRGGSRFVAEVKDSSAQTWLIRFEFSVTQSYILEFGNLYIRFYTLQSQLIDGGIPYEIVSPYSTSDLINSDGTFAISFVESADIIYLAHKKYQTRKLQRLGPVNWQLVLMTTTNGPFKTINITATTVTASAITGAVTLTASTAIFNASHVGSLFYVQQPLTTITQQWEAGKAVLLNDLRRSNGITYKAANAATTGTIKPIHTEGTISDGAVNWIYQDPGYGYGTITGFTSTTVVTLTVINQLPSNATGATTKWAFGSFSDIEGYPSQVNFFKERLTLAKDEDIHLSVSADYENFSSKDASGNVIADMAISLTLQSDKINSIQWLSSSDSLLCGTASNEFAVQSLTTNLPFGPDNVTAPPVAPFGSKSVHPVKVGVATLFVQRAGTKLRDIVYDFIYNKFDSKDNSILADHITIGGIKQMTYQQEPYSIIWAVRNDGQLVAMTYSREQYQDAPYGGWHRHIIGGSFNNGLAVVECIQSIPSPTSNRDDIWIIVKRTINGVTKRYIEFIDDERQFNDDPYDSFYVDSGSTLDRSAYNLVYATTSSTANAAACTLLPGTGATIVDPTGLSFITFITGFAIFSAGDIGRELHFRYSTLNTEDNKTLIWHTAKGIIFGFISNTRITCRIITAWPNLNINSATDWSMTTTIVTGLNYLEGESVAILGDGAVMPLQKIVSGQIILSGPCAKAQIGLPFSSRLKTMRFNAGAADGTSQGKTSRINKLVIRLFESLGLSFGSSFLSLEEMQFRDSNDLMDTAPPLFTGDKVLDFTSDYSTDPWVCIEQTDPLPATIICLVPILSTQDRS